MKLFSLIVTLVAILFSLSTTFAFISNGVLVSKKSQYYTCHVTPFQRQHVLLEKTTLVEISTSDPDSEIKTKEFDIAKVGAILAVPIVWGSYTPLVKWIYADSTSSISPPGLLFNLFSYLISVSTLLLAQTISKSDQFTQKSSDDSVPSPSFLTTTELTAGAELGFYLFCGSIIQIWGIQQTTSIKAAILVQLTTIVVPILDSVLEKKDIPKKLWLACAGALIGVLLVTTKDNFFSVLFGITSASLNVQSLQDVLFFNNGDFAICIASIFYSLHVVRLGKVANDVSPVNLACAKSLTGFFISLAIVAFVCLSGQSSGDEIIHYFSTVFDSSSSLSSQWQVGLVLLWNGVIATAVTNTAQTFGQQAVSPTAANLMYSSQPLWAGLYSFIFLGDRLSSTALVGVAFLVVSIYFAFMDNGDKNE